MKGYTVNNRGSPQIYHQPFLTGPSLIHALLKSTDGVIVSRTSLKWNPSRKTIPWLQAPGKRSYRNGTERVGGMHMTTYDPLGPGRGKRKTQMRAEVLPVPEGLAYWPTGHRIGSFVAGKPLHFLVLSGPGFSIGRAVTGYRNVLSLRIIGHLSVSSMEVTTGDPSCKFQLHKDLFSSHSVFGIDLAVKKPFLFSFSARRSDRIPESSRELNL